MPPVEFVDVVPGSADACPLGFVERERWSDDDGVIRNELTVGASEIWLDKPAPTKQPPH